MAMGGSAGLVALLRLTHDEEGERRRRSLENRRTRDRSGEWGMMGPKPKYS